MGLEIGESSKGEASFVEDDLFSWSKELILIEPYFEEARFEELCGDSVMVGALASVEDIYLICVEPLDLAPFHTHSFPPPLLICMHFMAP